jgi:hypothetical protein
MGKKDTHRMTKLLYTKPALVLFDARATAAGPGPNNDGSSEVAQSSIAAGS